MNFHEAEIGGEIRRLTNLPGESAALPLLAGGGERSDRTLHRSWLSRSIGSTDIAAGWDLLRAERARLDAFIEGASGSAAHDPRQWLRDTR